jgi:hypothetical protein
MRSARRPVAHWGTLPCRCGPGRPSGNCLVCRRWARFAGEVFARQALVKQPKGRA